MLNNLEKYDVVLGSNSPRRRELLNDMGVKFRVEAIKGIDETYPANLPVEDIPVFLARIKAEGHPLMPNELLITADTIVVLDEAVLGKPASEKDAHRMLRALSGRAHRVISGVCVSTAERVESFADTSIVLGQGRCLRHPGMDRQHRHFGNQWGFLQRDGLAHTQTVPTIENILNHT